MQLHDNDDAFPLNKPIYIIIQDIQDIQMHFTVSNNGIRDTYSEEPYKLIIYDSIPRYILVISFYI